MLTPMLRTAPIGSLAREMDRLFDGATRTHVWPALNVWRDRDDLVVEAEIPGFRLLEVLATEDTLTLRGERTVGRPQNATALRLERSVNRFERSLRLPVEIDADRVTASLDDGVLRITLPVAEAARPRRVTVTSIGSGARAELPASENADNA